MAFFGITFFRDGDEVHRSSIFILLPICQCHGGQYKYITLSTLLWYPLAALPPHILPYLGLLSSAYAHQAICEIDALSSPICQPHYLTYAHTSLCWSWNENQSIFLKKQVNSGNQEQVQKLTPPPLSTPTLISISLFSLIYTYKTWNEIFKFLTKTPPPPKAF